MDEIFIKRRSVRNFKDRKIEAEKLEEILEAAYSAPSAGDLKAREIIIVDNKDTKENLARASFGQDFIAQAPIVLVFFSIPERSAQRYAKRGRELYALQDATISASFAWLQAVKCGLSACWVGAFEDEKVKEILKAKEDWQPICIMPIGYEKK
jgi:nitroreductase